MTKEQENLLVKALEENYLTLEEIKDYLNLESEISETLKEKLIKIPSLSFQHYLKNKFPSQFS